MKRKLQVLMLCMFLTVVITACGGKEDKKSDVTATAPPQPTPENTVPPKADGKPNWGTPPKVLDGSKGAVAPAPEAKATTEAKVNVKTDAKATAASAPVAAAPTAPADYKTVRSAYAVKKGVPSEYSAKVNTLPVTEDNLKKGADIFKSNCSLCHGAKGEGDGPAGKALNPPASNLVALASMPVATDGYFLWAITDGGASLKTSMPTFKHIPEEGRWRLIMYIRSLVKK